MFKSARHIVASIGALVTIQGLIFSIIERNYFSLSFTLLGFLIVAGGLHVESLAAMRQAKSNLQLLVDRVKSSLRERAVLREERRELKRQQDEENARIEESLPVLEPEKPRVPRPRPRPQSRPTPVNVPMYNEPRTVVIVNEAPVMRWSPGLAAVFSFFIPGLGQLYKGQWFRAPLWFCFVSIGYFPFVIPGLLLHCCCILGALSGNPILRR